MLELVERSSYSLHHSLFIPCIYPSLPAVNPLDWINPGTTSITEPPICLALYEEQGTLHTITKKKASRKAQVIPTSWYI